MIEADLSFNFVAVAVSISAMLLRDCVLRAIRAKGLAGRCLMFRSVSIADRFLASHIKWNPPIPLIAHIFCAAIVAAA